MKTIALVAHDRRKQDMVEWATYNAENLKNYHLVCTGTTGTLVKTALENKLGFAVDVECKASGPKGGDAEIAAMIVRGEIDLLIFLEDDFNANPHQADISMSERQARIHNVFSACNRATADALIASPLVYDENYIHKEPSYVEFDRVKFETEHKV